MWNQKGWNKLAAKKDNWSREGAAAPSVAAPVEVKEEPWDDYTDRHKVNWNKGWSSKGEDWKKDEEVKEAKPPPSKKISNVMPPPPPASPRGSQPPTPKEPPTPKARPTPQTPEQIAAKEKTAARNLKARELMKQMMEIIEDDDAEGSGN